MDDSPAMDAPLLAFAQRAQAATAAWLEPFDAAGRIAAAWDVLTTVPPPAAVPERAVIARIISGFAQRLLTEGVSPIACMPRAPSARVRCESAVRLLLAAYADPALDLDHAASALGVSRWYLCHLFPRETGYRFSVHLHGLRVLKATLLLAAPLTVKEVAAGVGYLSAGELGRHFRQWMHMTASEFREGCLVYSCPTTTNGIPIDAAR
ncbi:MAG TPA: helix-turn-helix domain-containing protein [Vicinamibacterales bacterium]|nr:helix-turn-helix domain-containing protein [Vicinamibacterales bacterium]